MKKSFILYENYWKQIQLLDFEQCGRLFKAIFAHECGKELPKLDAITQMLYSVISDQLDRERDKYEAVSKKRAEAGRKGGIESGRVRALSSCKANEASSSDNENEYGNANGNVNANEKENGNNNEKKNENAVYDPLPPDVSPSIRQRYDRIMKNFFGLTPSQNSLDQYLNADRKKDHAS